MVFPTINSSAAVRHTARLMAMRLVLTAAVFCTALVLIGVGKEGADQAQQGIYWSDAFAFLAAACFGLVATRPEYRRLVLWCLVPVDVVIVTSLIHFSGGPESIFIFLYALVPLHAASVLGVSGAFSSALGTVVAYGAILLGYHLGWLNYYGIGAIGSQNELLYSWGVQSGLQFFVAMLASGLSRETRFVEAVLDQRTEALEKLRDLHECTVESLMSGLLTTNLSGCIMSFNAEAEKITGFSTPEVVGRAVEDVLPGVTENVLNAMGRPRSERVRVPFSRRGGELVHLGMAGSVLRAKDDSLGGYVVIFQDITAVVSMEQELGRSERMAALGQFATGLAHEIRNPLAAISGSAQMIAEDDWEGSAGDAASKRLMGIIVRETDRLNDLIESFISYARPAPGKVTEVPVRELIEEILSISERSRSLAIRCQVDIPFNLRICADAGQMRQVCWNLILNAFQAMPDGGELRVFTVVSKASEEENRTQGGGELIDLCFKDTGIGIEPKLLDRIFDPFVTTKHKGTGLGLSVVHRLVDSAGGSIQVTSALGIGTEIHLLLPIAEGEA